MRIRKTHDTFVAEMKIIDEDITVISKYVKSSEKVKVEHNCGHVWKPTANSLLSGKGCPSCAGRCKTTKSFKIEVKKINRNFKILGEYVKDYEHIKTKCKKCKYKWMITASHLLQGKGCPNCAGNARTNTLGFKKKLKSINSDIKILGEYINSKTVIKVKCKKCKYKWYPQPSHLTGGKPTGCPSCADHGFNPKKEATLYLYEINNKYLGYGITRDFKHRQKVHHKNLTRNGYVYKIINTYDFKLGKDALFVENLIKNKFKNQRLNVEGFKKECVKIKHIEKIKRIICEVL